MKVSRENIPVKTLVNKVNKDKIILKHKLQRREGCWNKTYKSLLIDSLLRGFLVNPIYVTDEEKIMYVIDGVQRLSTLRMFYNDEFSLSKDLEPLTIGDDTYEIAGKKYSKLEDEVKDILDAAQLTVYEITEYTDKEVREMFKRINLGKKLNTIQSMTPNMSDEVSSAISDIISLPFFENRLTDSQLKGSVDQNAVLEALMLSKLEEGETLSFRRVDKERFFNDTKTINNAGILESAISRLDALLPENVLIPKTSIAFICYAAYRIDNEGRSFEEFADNVMIFLEEYDENTDYKSNLMNGTTSTDSVMYRLKYWDDIVDQIGMEESTYTEGQEETQEEVQE